MKLQTQLFHDNTLKFSLCLCLDLDLKKILLLLKNALCFKNGSRQAWLLETDVVLFSDCCSAVARNM